MNISEVIKKLEELKAKAGDLPIYIWDNTYLEEYELKPSYFKILKQGQGKKGKNQQLPERLSVG